MEGGYINKRQGCGASILFFFVLLVIQFPLVHADVQPVLIGLDADMSSASAQSGKAIRQGAEVAIAEINAQGGLLGRPLELMVKDHRGNPARGRDNIQAFAREPDLLAVLGGLHTPVALSELPLVHQHKIIYLGPWAAGTDIVDNGYSPNYVFRLSVRDQFAGDFLVRAAKQHGHGKLGLLLERTGWGRSNQQAMSAAAAKQGLQIVSTQWFNVGVHQMDAQINALRKAGAQVIMLVSNVREGGSLVRALAAVPAEQRLPVISHWGISGGAFAELAGNALSVVDLELLQTYSFFKPVYPQRSEHFLQLYRRLFPANQQLKDMRSAVGIAHAYDLLHLLAKAVRKAGTLQRDKVRRALEELPLHEGLVRNYAPAFTAERHDALGPEDFIMARFREDGTIVPSETP